MPRRRIMMISTHGYVGAEPELGKPDTGGQVVYVLELSKCLGRLGYQVDIFTRRFEGQAAVDQVDKRVRVVRLPCGGRDFIPKEHMCNVIPEWVTNCARYVKDKHRRYMFINSHYWDAGLAGQTLSHYLGVPHIHTPHSIGAWKRDNMDGDPDELETKYNFKKRVQEEKVIYDECDVLIATTPEQREILKKSEYDASGDKIYVVPPGYDDMRFYPISEAHCKALKQEYGYPGKIILAVGRIAANKGYDLLLRAMPPVFSRVKDARLLLAIGSMKLTREEREYIRGLKKLAEELRIRRRVKFTNYIPDEELANYYRFADVFALSSRYEPFGMTAVEAMACGTPAVITTGGGLWEQLRWGLDALYANPLDPEAFGHAIAAILQHKRISDQLAKFGSQKARLDFTWMGIAQHILRIVEGVSNRPYGPNPAEGD